MTPSEPAPTSPDGWFHEGSRQLQRRFATVALADRIVSKFVTPVLAGDDRAFVERADMFFLATADDQGRPSCSYKGGDPGFVKVVDEHTIAFPNYDGNGMFLSWGNTLRNPEVGLLFIDFERRWRMRLNGTASIDPDDPLLSAFPEAQFIVRVQVREVFPNCTRYIHHYQLVERSRYVPKAGCATPVPDWKRDEWAKDVLAPAPREEKSAPVETPIAELHRRACQQITDRLEQVGPEQWALPTPCTEWNVAQLVGHVVSGTSWVAPLVAGQTIAQVGNRFEGDLLGDDPLGAWQRAATAAQEACQEEGAAQRLVHLSGGDTPAADYLAERVLDLVMHTWDLARAIGADEHLDPELVEAARTTLAEKADLWRRHGALGPAVEVPAGADSQTHLLAESGRTP